MLGADKCEKNSPACLQQNYRCTEGFNANHRSSSYTVTDTVISS